MNGGIAERELALVAVDTPKDMVDQDIAQAAMRNDRYDFARVLLGNCLQFAQSTGKELTSGLAMRGSEVGRTGAPQGILLRVMPLDFRGGESFPRAILALTQLSGSDHCQPQWCTDDAGRFGGTR